MGQVGARSVVDKERALISEFKEKLTEYYESRREGVDLESHRARVQELRQWLNRNIPLVTMHANRVGISTSIYYSPPPAVGGIRGEFDLLGNLFQLSRFQIAPTMVYDMLDRAIGQYDALILERRRKLVNPFYWLGAIIRLPFKFLDFAGFNGKSIEKGIAGKLYKLVASIGAAVLVTLEIYGHLKPILNSKFGLDLP